MTREQLAVDLQVALEAVELISIYYVFYRWMDAVI